MNLPISTAPSATRIFLAFAVTYFFSALLRAVTATLAPAFSSEFGLAAGDLGLLAGAYFLGFSLLQLPLGSALDRVGPKRVLLSLLVLAVLGCAAFALATGMGTLVMARGLIGMGVAACLMAPLTCFRARFSPAVQLRLNSWMLMAGSVGMVASTLPVQWLLPWWGWRGLFWATAVLLMLSMALLMAFVPADPVPAPASTEQDPDPGYRAIFSHPVFVRSVPIGFFMYGGLVAIQALWAGPWLTRVAGQTAQGAAGGLFFINVCMLFAFMAWGFLMPPLSRRGFTAHGLMVWGLPVSLLLMAGIVLWPVPASSLAWAAWCVSSTFVSLSQPAVGQAFSAHLAGRALSAYNLVIFLGVFSIQWGIGLGIDLARWMGCTETAAYRWAFGAFGACCALSYAWYLKPPGCISAGLRAG